MRVDLRPAEPHDPAWFAPRLRPADTAELVAASGPDVRATLERALGQSLGKAWVAMLGEEPIALFGLAPFGLLASSAAPWMVGTPTLLTQGRALMEVGRAYCAMAKSEFSLLVNYVDVRNEASVRWLKRLGFEMGEPVPFGVEQRPFMRFEMRSDHV